MDNEKINVAKNDGINLQFRTLDDQNKSDVIKSIEESLKVDLIKVAHQLLLGEKPGDWVDKGKNSINTLGLYNQNSLCYIIWSDLSIDIVEIEVSLR